MEDKSISWDDLTLRVESHLSNAIAGLSKNSWEEDSISFTVTKAIQLALNDQLVSGPHPLQLKAHIFKAKKKVTEEQHGDIFVIVQFGSTTSAERGVGYLEAKKRDWDREKFSAIKPKKKQGASVSMLPKTLTKKPAPRLGRASKQLCDIHNNSRHPYLVLYDRLPIAEQRCRFLRHRAASIGVGRWRRRAPLYGSDINELFLVESVYRLGGYAAMRDYLASMVEPALVTSFTHVLAVQMGTVLDSEVTPDTLYRRGIPLSTVVTERFLQGQDLDWRDDVIQKGLVEAKDEEVPQVVLYVVVAANTDKELPSSPRIDRFMERFEGA